MATNSAHQAAPQVAIVGAGMVGLCTAWFLQGHGAEVTVFDKDGVAAGSSWGNAGWLTPGLATPLPEPAVLKYGIKALLSPSSPVYVPVRGATPELVGFTLRFARNSTMKRWRRAMSALIGLNAGALDAFDELAASDSFVGGVSEPTLLAEPFIAAYRTSEERAGLLEEIRHIRSAGQPLEFDVLTGDQARAMEPVFSERIGAAIALHGQRYLHPARYVAGLAQAVRQRGAHIVEGTAVESVHDVGDKVEINAEAFDRVVLASGAWLSVLAKSFGVRRHVQSGRGYSFTVPVDKSLRGPVYFPAQRVACTPDGDRLRIAGMMEFKAADAPKDPRRVKALVDAARPLLKGADLDDRADEWVGARPCTADGLGLIGATNSPRVFVAGGHGMWGMTLGPITGKLLAEQMVTGRIPSALRPFNPLR